MINVISVTGNSGICVEPVGCPLPHEAPVKLRLPRVHHTEREYSDDDFEDIEEKLRSRNRQESFNIDIASERTNIRTNLEN